MRTALATVAIAALAAGCAHDVLAHYPSLPNEQTSSLVLLLGAPADGVSVAVDGRLVVDDVHTSRVVVDRIPLGPRDVVVAANGADKQLHVWIEGDHATTVPVGVHDGGPGFLLSLLGTIITLVVYTWLKV
jgi:hypothetical protein